MPDAAAGEPPAMIPRATQGISFRIHAAMRSGAGAVPAPRYFEAFVTHSVVTDFE
jgi:hypothetical protein